jgi:hypothetical protein
MAVSNYRCNSCKDSGLRIFNCFDHAEMIECFKLCMCSEGTNQERQLQQTAESKEEAARIVHNPAAIPKYRAS